MVFKNAFLSLCPLPNDTLFIFFFQLSISFKYSLHYLPLLLSAHWLFNLVTVHGDFIKDHALNKVQGRLWRLWW